MPTTRHRGIARTERLKIRKINIHILLWHGRESSKCALHELLWCVSTQYFHFAIRSSAELKCGFCLMEYCQVFARRVYADDFRLLGAAWNLSKQNIVFALCVGQCGVVHTTTAAAVALFILFFNSS